MATFYMCMRCKKHNIEDEEKLVCDECRKKQQEKAE